MFMCKMGLTGLVHGTPMIEILGGRLSHSILTVIFVSLFYQPLVIVIFVRVAGDLKCNVSLIYGFNNMLLTDTLKCTLN